MLAWAAGCVAAASPSALTPSPPPIPVATATLTPILEPLKQVIGVAAPAPGDLISETIALVGEIALTPLDRQLVARVTDIRGRRVLTQTVPVAGEPGARGVFSQTLALPFLLPGAHTLEVIAPSHAVSVEVRVAARVVEPAPGVQLTVNGVARSTAAHPLAALSPQRSWLPLFGHPAGLRITFDGDPPGAQFDPRRRQLLILPVASYRALYRGADADEFDAILGAIRRGTPAGRTLLPVSDWEAAFFARVVPLRFANGGGVRQVTMFAQQIQPALADNLTYVFQGLSDDGRYFVAAFIPITSTALPAETTDAVRQHVRMDYRRYLAATARQLEAEETFSPPLEALDAMIASLTITDVLALGEAERGVVQATDLLNVRSGPGTRFAIIGQLAPSERVRALAQTPRGDWVQIALADGRRGWASAQYLSPRDVIQALPTVVP